MEQNRKRYSSLAKAIVIGLQMIAAVVASVSIVLFSTCVNQNMLNMGDLQNSSFVESGYFERTFSKQMMQLLDYLNLREAFETDGVFDENRPETVNAVTGKNCGLQRFTTTNMTRIIPMYITGWVILGIIHM